MGGTGNGEAKLLDVSFPRLILVILENLLIPSSFCQTIIALCFMVLWSHQTLSIFRSLKAFSLFHVEQILSKPNKTCQNLFRFCITFSLAFFLTLRSIIIP
jgi:hypothetical protein